MSSRERFWVCFPVKLVVCMCIYIFLSFFFLLFNMYKREIVFVFQLFVIIIIDVGYACLFSWLLYVIPFDKFKFVCSVSPESLIILNLPSYRSDIRRCFCIHIL